VAAIDAVKAATTAMIKQKRIVREDVIVVWARSLGSDKSQGEGMKISCLYVLNAVLYIMEQVHLKILSN
jgi:hypothetical protein